MPELTSRYPFFISIFLLAAAFICSYYFYRRTTLLRPAKYFLIVLKTIALFILAFLFLEPTILTVVRSVQKPVSIVLIDDSRSNSIQTSNKIKEEEILRLYQELDKTADETYSFSSSASSMQGIAAHESLLFNGFETNLHRSLIGLRQKYSERIFQSITVVSDGILNEGRNPLYAAKTFECPFVTIGIGDTVQGNDLVINVFHNDKALTDAINPMKVELKTYGFRGKRVKVSLIREGTTVSEKFAEIQADEQTTDLSFEVKEPKAGTIQYSVLAETLPGEITYKNNSEEFLIEYFENKVNVLYISGAPGYDNVVVADVLKRIRNYSVTIKTQKLGNDFYEGGIDYKSFAELSTVILNGFPSTNTSSEMVSVLAGKVREFNVPLIFFAGRNTDYKKLDQFGDLIPFTVGRPETVESNASAQTTGTGEMEGMLKKVFPALQIFRNIGSVIQKPGAQVLLIDKLSREPLLITRFTDNTKATAFLGYGLWRWRLNSSESHEEILENFILEIVNSSLIKERKSRFTVTPSKRIFDYTEAATFSAELYDESFNPVTDGIIKAMIVSGENVIKKDLQFVPAENRYILNAGELPAGDYQIHAVAEIGGNYFAEDEARFLSDTTNLEFKITRSHFENLKMLSDNTGGMFFTDLQSIDSIDNFLNSLSIEDQTETMRYLGINLWENKYLLFAAVLLFAVEWVLRKRNNIP